MTKEINKELLFKITEKAYDYSNSMYELHRAAINPNLLKSGYACGVLDGIENTSYQSYMAGAKAMYKLLNQNEQTD